MILSRSNTQKPETKGYCLLTEKVLNGTELIFFHEQHGLINENGKIVLPIIMII